MFYQISFQPYANEEIQYSVIAPRNKILKVIEDIINDNKGEITFITKTYPKFSTRLSAWFTNRYKVVEYNAETAKYTVYHKVKI